jgi:hypothetical protein
MTIFDTETDRYLERLGASRSSADWTDVVQRSNRARRRSRVTRAAVAVGAGATAAVVALAAVGALGGPGSTSIVEKAEAAVLAPVQAAPGTIEHILVQYRTNSGETFIEYETWIAGDGAFCRRTVEGLAGQAAPDTRLTRCRPSEDVVEVYLPGENQILRAQAGTQPEDDSAREDSGASAAGEGPRYFRVRELPDGSKDADIVVKRNGKYYKVLDVGPDGSSADLFAADWLKEGDWLREDIVEAFRQDAVREDGTMVLDGREYTKLVTEDGLNAVLVDPETGEAVAWIPPTNAFGAPTTVVRTHETLPDNAENRRNLSLTELYPDAVVREVSATDLARTIEAQYPRG